MAVKSLYPKESVALGALEGADLVSTLTRFANLFVFAYSLKRKVLISWTENAPGILGVRDVNIATDGNLFLRHVHPDDRYLLMTDLVQALRGSKPYRATYRWIRPDNNEVRWLHCRASVVREDGEELFRGVIIDLSDEFTGEVSRIAGPDSIQTVLAAFPTLVFTVDRDLRLMRINRHEDQQHFNFGDEKFQTEQFRIGRSLLAGFCDKDLKAHYKQVADELLEGKFPHYRNRITLGESVFNLEIVPLSEHAIIEGLLFNVSDISDSVKLERQLAQLQKAEGLGLLAAGVAHNFNNALQGILGHAAILAHHSDKPEFVRQAGEAIMEIVNRSSELTRQMMVLDAGEQSAEALTDLNLVAMAAANRVQDLFAGGIKVAVTFGNPGRVKGNQAQLVEAVEAIIRNAQEALGQKSQFERSLAVKTAPVTLAQYEISDLPEGDYAKLTVSDSGPGMADETAQRCLEPFYTTKEHDKQSGVGLKPSGLGLSRAFAIVRKLGGTLTIDSRTGVGTSVSMYVPSETAPANPNQIELTSSKVTPLRARPPEILVVDDDQMVLQTIGAMLRDIGYQCVLADDATKAFASLRSHQRTLKLALIDAVMPGVDGASVIRELKKISPTLKVIGFSGASPEQTKPLLNEGALMVLRKPIGPRELGEAIRGALDLRPSAVGA